MDVSVYMVKLVSFREPSGASSPIRLHGFGEHTELLTEPFETSCLFSECRQTNLTPDWFIFLWFSTHHWAARYTVDNPVVHSLLSCLFRCIVTLLCAAASLLITEPCRPSATGPVNLWPKWVHCSFKQGCVMSQ